MYQKQSGEFGREWKLKTVTEIRRSSACDTFITESVFLVLNKFFAGLRMGRFETAGRYGQFYVCIFQLLSKATAMTRSNV